MDHAPHNRTSFSAQTPVAPKRLRLSIVEDEKTTREELVTLLQRNPRFEIVGSYANAEVALHEIPRRTPELVLMDLHLERTSGAECTRRLKAQLPDLKIVVLTKHEDADHLFAALRAGADGYLLKKFKDAELQSGILAAMEGGAPMTGEIAIRMRDYFRQIDQSNAKLAALSPREHEILELLAKGHLYKEIGGRLALSYTTVNTHVKRIYKKLQVNSRGEAVAKFHGQP